MDRSTVSVASCASLLTWIAGAAGDVVIAKALPGVVPSLERSPVLSTLGVVDIRRTLDFEVSNPALAQALGLDRYYTIHLQEGIDATVGIAALTRVNLFESVEREHIGTTAGEIPNDPEFARQWSLHNIGQGTSCTVVPRLHLAAPALAGLPDINAMEAWGIATQAPTIRVAVLDSGVNQHPELEQFSASWALDGGSANDQCNHGTHVSGIIAAKANNGMGIAGVVWGGAILPVRVLTGCNGTDVNYGLGLIWAADRAHVANSSLQYYSVGSFMADAVAYAAGQGMIMVAASGNWQNVIAYPARYPQVIAVGATRIDDARASFSNSGPQLDLCAPGESVLSLHAFWAQPGNSGYFCQSGTSMASPHVAGAAALIKGIIPEATPQQVRRILVSSVKDLGAPGHDPLYGWGRLDLQNALRLARCYADADFNGELNTSDLATFNTRFSLQHPYADLNDDGQWDPADQALYMDLYHKGCP